MSFNNDWENMTPKERANYLIEQKHKRTSELLLKIVIGILLCVMFLSIILE